ncbi:hypothetical protein [Luteimonas huabeiensis]|uniref:hypothetical protein n=1 Tax=Luteimonas huabeiensis TaxID=1244513 RepID=UPI0004643B84|nr:hypothetical protein [Luteimonas huabeiensis]
MPITRARASALLNQREMALYDDSRVNVLRKLDAKALDSRIVRAREARNRARDLVQRQKLASRDRTGSKRGASGAANQRSKDKAELLADVLARFEDQRKQVGRAVARTATASAARKAPAKRGAAAKPSTTGRSGTAKKAAAKKTAVKKTARKTTGKTAKTTAAKTTAGKTAAGATAAGRKIAKTAAKAAGEASRGSKPAASGRKRAAAGSAGGAAVPRKGATRRARITPEQALERTRALLEAKQARDREPKPWEAVAHGEGGAAQPGYQSDAAARRAEQLHEAEARLPAIHGSNSTRDRLNQGRRDHRRAPGDE